MHYIITFSFESMKNLMKLTNDLFLKHKSLYAEWWWWWEGRMATCDGACIVLSHQEASIGSLGHIKGQITSVNSHKVTLLWKMELLFGFA